MEKSIVDAQFVLKLDGIFIEKMRTKHLLFQSTIIVSGISGFARQRHVFMHIINHCCENIIVQLINDFDAIGCPKQNKHN